MLLRRCIVLASLYKDNASRRSSEEDAANIQKNYTINTNVKKIKKKSSSRHPVTP